jgi:hypothetical protein
MIETSDICLVVFSFVIIDNVDKNLLKNINYKLKKANSIPELRSVAKRER